jgi:hypothetical protein
MSRNDISDFLIHFTRGDSLKDAFQRLQKIVDERQLLGSCRPHQRRLHLCLFLGGAFVLFIRRTRQSSLLLAVLTFWNHGS